MRKFLFFQQRFARSEPLFLGYNRMLPHLSSKGVQYVDINITDLCQIAHKFLMRQRSGFATVVSAFMCSARHAP